MPNIILDSKIEEISEIKFEAMHEIDAFIVVAIPRQAKHLK